jgi:hypothetical protein
MAKTVEDASITEVSTASLSALSSSATASRTNDISGSNDGSDRFTLTPSTPTPSGEAAVDNKTDSGHQIVVVPSRAFMDDVVADPIYSTTSCTSTTTPQCFEENDYVDCGEQDTECSNNCAIASSSKNSNKSLSFEAQAADLLPPSVMQGSSVDARSELESCIMSENVLDEDLFSMVAAANALYHSNERSMRGNSRIEAYKASSSSSPFPATPWNSCRSFNSCVIAAEFSNRDFDSALEEAEYWGPSPTPMTTPQDSFSFSFSFFDLSESSLQLLSSNNPSIST